MTPRSRRSSRFARVGALLPLILTCALVGCTRSSKPNVLLVVIDTLRADRVGAVGGGENDRTPFLDSLAKHGFVFHNAYAQSSWTNASVASLFTSRYQSQHRVMSFWAELKPTETTLAEALVEHGYSTGGFVANFLLRGNLGFGQGFDHYETFWRKTTDAHGKPANLKGSADQVNAAALAWLDEVAKSPKKRQPVFLYVHYMEPHAPYDPPDDLLEQVLAGAPKPDLKAVNARASMPNIGKYSDELMADIRHLYDAEVLNIDRKLRGFFGTLAERGFLRDTVVIITADHGEEFREHGTLGHHQALYEESIRVPLIVLVPGREQHVDIDAIVSLTDIAPTVLDFAHIPPPPRFAGSSLLPLMEIHLGTPAPGPTRRNVAFSELIKETTSRLTPHERAVISAHDKMIVGVDNEHEYFDLERDPGERQPQALSSERRSELGTTLENFIEQHHKDDAQATPATEQTVDPETLERMRALGYRP